MKAANKLNVLKQLARQKSKFSEDAHPRHLKGSSKGGQFAPKTKELTVSQIKEIDSFFGNSMENRTGVKDLQTFHPEILSSEAKSLIYYTEMGFEKINKAMRSTRIVNDDEDSDEYGEVRYLPAGDRESIPAEEVEPYFAVSAGANSALRKLPTPDFDELAKIYDTYTVGDSFKRYIEADFSIINENYKEGQVKVEAAKGAGISELGIYMGFNNSKTASSNYPFKESKAKVILSEL